jgi:hypothetical protein
MPRALHLVAMAVEVPMALEVIPSPEMSMEAAESGAHERMSMEEDCMEQLAFG